jgi:hypothetical protein
MDIDRKQEEVFIDFSFHCDWGKLKVEVMGCYFVHAFQQFVYEIPSPTQTPSPPYFLRKKLFKLKERK